MSAPPRAPAHLFVLALTACGDAAITNTSADTSTTSTTSTTSIDPSAAPTTSTASTTAEGSTTAGTSDTGDPPPPTYCAQLDISLVMDPKAPVYGQGDRAALVQYFDDMVLQTGARVRILPNVGSEFLLTTDCLLPLGNPADDPILVWGEAGVLVPGAPDALQCLLDAIDGYTSDFDQGNYIFSGLLFPVLERPDWPAPGSTGLAMLISSGDDTQNNMYAQPGQASEAYLRLVGEGDRRRVSAFVHAHDATDLHIFSYAISSRSRYYERASTTLAAALADFTPLALDTCDAFDFIAPLPDEPPSGCKRIDLLFAIDGSGSMTSEQDALRGASGQPPLFLEFTDALLAELTEVDDFHVGVVSSQLGDTLLHTHTDFPALPESPATDCGLPPGQRWLVGPSPTLASDFACIAATKSDTDEVTYYNAAEALGLPANAGFLRDDSLLVLVLLTDEDTYDFVITTMTAIRSRILKAIGYDLRRLVVLAIAGGQGVFEAPTSICQGIYGDAVPGRRIISLTRSFRERGVFQDICQGDLAKAFTEILGDIVSACQAFEPVP